MRVYELIDYCLRIVGVTKAFGVPGSLIMPIWQNIGAEVILCGHEQEASYVAVGYSKATREPVAILTTGGPGVLNAISGIAAANIDSIPMICISGRTSIADEGRGVRQEESHFNRMIDSYMLLPSVTKYAAVVTGAHDARIKILRAFSEAITPRKGSVYISIPIDIQNLEIGSPGEGLMLSRMQKGLRALPAIKDRPLLVIGWGCWMAGAVTKVYKLAESLGAPVVVTSKAYCCADSSSSCYLGKLGYAYNESITSFIEKYAPNQLISFGSSLGDKDCNSAFWRALSGAEIVCLGQDLSHIKRRLPNAFLCEVDNMSDAVEAISRDARLSKAACDDRIILEARREAEMYWKRRILEKDKMAQACDALNNLNRVVITADAGNHLLNVAALLNPKRPGELFIDVGLRAMGTGICFCAGMAEAFPSRRYVAVTGDGCMLMNGNVMHFVASRKLPVTFLVFNNQTLGRVRVGQSLTGNYRSTDIEGVSLRRYGESFGLLGYSYTDVDRLSRELPAIAYSSNPAIVEVVVPQDEIPVTIKNSIS